MGIYKSVVVAVTTTGSDASATGNTDSETFVGAIEGLYLDYNSDSPATTDIVVSDKRTGVEILRINNANTDVYKVPRIYAVDNANAALTSDVTPQKYLVDQGINVDVAGANVNTNEIVVTCIYEKGS